MLLFLGWFDKNAIRCLAGDDAEIKQTERKKRGVEESDEKKRSEGKNKARGKRYSSWQSKEWNQMRVINEREE